MRLKTVDELSTYLREDLGWRRRENYIFKSLVNSASEAKKQAVLRGAIPALYAHWEGYVKLSCRAYFDFVKERKLLMSEICVPLLSLVFRSRLKRVVGDQTLDSHLDFTEWLLQEWSRRAHLPETNAIIATSNLTSIVFKDLMLGLGLPYLDQYARAEKPIIDQLVHMRNHLAHGEWVVLSEKEYDEFHMWITRLMESVCEEIETAAATSAFRRSLVQVQ